MTFLGHSRTPYQIFLRKYCWQHGDIILNYNTTLVLYFHTDKDNISNENSMAFLSFSSARATEIHPPSKDEELKVNRFKMGMVLDTRWSWESIVIMVSYSVHYDTLVQNATDIITKCESYFITKCDKSLLQNASPFLLQNTTLLQNAMFITKCVSTSCWFSFLNPHIILYRFTFQHGHEINH